MLYRSGVNQHFQYLCLCHKVRQDVEKERVSKLLSMNIRVHHCTHFCGYTHIQTSLLTYFLLDILSHTIYLLKTTYGKDSVTLRSQQVFSPPRETFTKCTKTLNSDLIVQVICRRCPHKGVTKYIFREP